MLDNRRIHGSTLAACSLRGSAIALIVTCLGSGAVGCRGGGSSDRDGDTSITTGGRGGGSATPATAGTAGGTAGGTAAGGDGGAHPSGLDASSTDVSATDVNATDVSATDVGAMMDGEASLDAAADHAASDIGATTDASPEAATSADVPAESAPRDGDADSRTEGGASTTTDEQIHYYGRWNRLADRAITVNTGSHVAARFMGAGLSARFDISLNQIPTPTLAWRIDQDAWQEGELQANLPLATGLAPGQHEVILMVRGLNENQNRWAAPLVSSITFLGFTASGGAVVPSPRPIRPKIELLGDSITEGINVWVTHAGQATPCWRSDGRLAYASQAAQLLGAEWRQVGFGRQGLLIGGNGGVPAANESFNLIYQGVTRDAWQADMVVINQGTNDGAASAASFRSAYATFIGTVRAGYRTAKIVAMRPFGGAHAAEIRAEVDARTAAGDARIFFLDTTGWLSAADYTDGVHPNATGSAKAAQALAAAIATIGLP